MAKKPSTAMKAPAKPKGKVVAASLTAGGANHLGSPLQLDSRAIERAMGEAHEQALADGVTDDQEILKLKLAARDRVKAEFKKAEVAEIARIQAEAEKGV